MSCYNTSVHCACCQLTAKDSLKPAQDDNNIDDNVDYNLLIGVVIATVSVASISLLVAVVVGQLSYVLDFPMISMFWIVRHHPHKILNLDLYDHNHRKYI